MVTYVYSALNESNRIVLFFRTRMVQTELRIHVPFLQSLLCLSFRFSRPSLSVKGTKPRGEYLILSWWNWFVHYGKLDSRTKFAIPEFFYHLPKPWTDWFAHVNCKQPPFCTIRRVPSHTCYTEKKADIFPARVHTSQSCKNWILVDLLNLRDTHECK